MERDLGFMALRERVERLAEEFQYPFGRGLKKKIKGGWVTTEEVARRLREVLEGK